MNHHKLLTSSLLVIGILIFGMSACSKIEDLIRFSFKDSADITIPSQNTLNTGFITIPSPEIQTSSQQAFEQNNTNAKYVKDARLTELKLTITAPESQTFSFLNEIKIYISAPGLEEVLIASKTAIPNDVGRELLLDVADINLKPYIQGETYNIRTDAKVDQITTQEVKIKADMTFSVTADVF